VLPITENMKSCKKSILELFHIKSTRVKKMCRVFARRLSIYNFVSGKKKSLNKNYKGAIATAPTT
jgi:hypothetical protein